MQNIKRRLSLVHLVLFSFVLSLTGCEKGNINRVHQSEGHWVVFNLEETHQHEKEVQWQFELNRAGKYDIQVITAADSLTANNLETIGALIAIDNQKVTAELKQSFRITFEGKPANVFQYQTVYNFKKAGIHTLTFKSDSRVQQIRLVPNYKNSLASGAFKSQWLAMHESPEKQAALKWFKEARFGMFIHWGLYSGAAGEWKNTRIKDSTIPGPKVAEWLMYKFHISREEYAELAKSFNPDKSFAQNIAQLAKDVGMKYVVITSKHHDGFALFDSKVSDYDMMDATPYKADLIKELYDAVVAEGLEFGVYYSHGNDWADGTDGNYANIKKKNDALGIYTHAQGKNLWDPSNNTHSEYLQSKAYPQIAELINLLPDLRVLWFDGDGLITEEQAFNFYKLVFEMNPNILVNRRVGFDFGDYMDSGDNVIPSSKDILNKHWETCGTTNNSWGYNEHDHNWKSTKELLYYFIDITSKGGNYLLNIGPDGKGKVPEMSARRLREMGQWVHTNSAAIFGTTSWKVHSEGQGESLLKGTGHREAKGFTRTFTQEDFWFTARSYDETHIVYAMSLVKPSDKVVIKSLNANAVDIDSIKLLGSYESLKWKQNAEALVVDFTDIETTDNGFAIEVLLK